MPNGTIQIDKGQITSQVDNADGSTTIKAQLPCGENITLSAVPSVDYTLEYIKKNGVPKVSIVPAGDTLVFNSDEEPAINVRFKKNAPAPAATYKVRVEASGNTVRVQREFGGTYWDFYDQIGNAVEYTFNAGETFAPVFSIRPADAGGFDFNSIAIINPTPVVYLPSVVNQQIYYHSMVINRDYTIQINPKLKGSATNYSVTTQTTGSGSATPNNQILPAGANTSIYITPLVGWRIKTILINDSPFVGFTPSGYTLPLNNINANIIVKAIFELIGAADLPAATINYAIYSRLIGSNQLAANQWDDSSFITVSTIARRVKSAGISINPFVLPFNYQSTYLETETDYNTPDGVKTVKDDFYDSLNTNYLRLAIQQITKSITAVVSIYTRLNNVWGNGGAGYSAGQVSSCTLKVTNPDGVVATFNHPVQGGVSDVLHQYTITKLGIYTVEVEAVLANGTRTSYSKSFMSFIN